jgi:hypothetical protein
MQLFEFAPHTLMAFDDVLVFVPIHSLWSSIGKSCHMILTTLWVVWMLSSEMLPIADQLFCSVMI